MIRLYFRANLLSCQYGYGLNNLTEGEMALALGGHTQSTGDLGYHHRGQRQVSNPVARRSGLLPFFLFPYLFSLADQADQCICSLRLPIEGAGISPFYLFPGWPRSYPRPSQVDSSTLVFPWTVSEVGLSWLVGRISLK